MIEEFYNNEHRNEYFAIRALFQKIEDSNGYQENLIDDVQCTFIRKKSSEEDEDAEDELITYSTDKIDIIEKFMFLPAMKDKNRHCIFCQGQAGGGKSYLLDDYVKLYKLINPKNDVLYFTLNTAEIDKSLTLKNYKIMPMQEFFEQLKSINTNLEEIKKIAPLFQNKLLVFDDVGNLKNNKDIQKTFWNFIDQSIENFRKFNVNVYIIAHSSRTGNHGTIMKEEMTHYIITGSALQTQNDRILTAYFGLTMKETSAILDHDERFVCFDTKKKICIYPNKIKMLNLKK